MKALQSLLPAFGLLVAGAQAWGSGWNETYTTLTITTDIFTTVCPSATTFTQGTKTYTATESQTFTITDCPCSYTTSLPVWGTGTGSSKPTATVVPPPVLTTTTITTDVYTTYCPSSTEVVQNSKTYTVSEAITLTITDCPCTEVITTTCAPATSLPASVIPPPISVNGTVTTGKPATTIETVSVLTTYCPSSSTIVIGSQTITLSSGTNTVPIVTPITTASPSKTPVGPKTTSSGTSPAEFTGAAKRFEAGGAAAMAAGLAALLL